MICLLWYLICSMRVFLADASEEEEEEEEPEEVKGAWEELIIIQREQQR